MSVNEEGLSLTGISQEAVNWTTTVKNVYKKDQPSFDSRLQDRFSWAIPEILLCSLWLIPYLSIELVGRHWQMRDRHFVELQTQKKNNFYYQIAIKWYKNFIFLGKIELYHYIEKNIRLYSKVEKTVF